VRFPADAAVRGYLPDFEVARALDGREDTTCVTPDFPAVAITSTNHSSAAKETWASSPRAAGGHWAALRSPDANATTTIAVQMLHFIPEAPPTFTASNHTLRESWPCQRSARGYSPCRGRHPCRHTRGYPSGGVLRNVRRSTDSSAFQMSPGATLMYTVPRPASSFTR
jgi:hypothetical protein